MDRHLQTCLQDWDLDEELGLATTTDQFHQEETGGDEFLMRWQRARLARGGTGGKTVAPNASETQAVDEANVRPHMWLMVNPRLACDIKYPEREPERTFLQKTPTKVCPLDQDLPPSPSSSSSPTGWVLSEDEACLLPLSRVTIPGRAGMKSVSRGPNKWQQPPASYFVLIALVMRSSLTHSLTLQEIYSFMCEHFPYFLTASKGWKNGIRRNLCFNRNFKMVSARSSGTGCRQHLWSLTSEGEVRLREDLKVLSQRTLNQIKSSMMRPELLLQSSPD